MPDCHPSFAIRRIALPASQWTEIIAVIDCCGFNLRSANGFAVRVRTDKDDPETEDTLFPNSQEVILTPPPPGCGRFTCGCPIFFARPAGDADDVAVCRFVR